MTLSALPTLNVYIAFNPTTLYSTTQTWTDVTEYVRDFQTKSGRQHFLDRPEAATLQLTVSNRTGYFSQTGTLALPRIPIKVTATWSGTTYPVYFGIIDTVTERVTDALNVDLDIQASDLTKYLSLRYVNSPAFWKTYAASSSVTNWYDCNQTTTANLVGASYNYVSGSGSSTVYTLTFTYAPGSTHFTVGQYVSVSGFTNLSSGSTVNPNPQFVEVASTTSTTFTTANITGAIGTGELIVTGTGSAFVSQLSDPIGSTTANIFGVSSFTTNGAVIYEVNTALDLSNGNTSTGSAYLNLPANSSFGGIDLWVLGAGLLGIWQLSSSLYYYVSGTYHQLLWATNDLGQLYLNYGSTLVATSANPINDGYWHHVGLYVDSVQGLCFVVDGVVTAVGPTGGHLSSQSNPIAIGGSGEWPGYVDEIVISSVTSTLTAEVLQRYKAGSLLQLGTPTTNNNIFSGDRIAEILTLGGWGSITGGSISVTSGVTTTTPAVISLNNTLYIGGNGTLTTWAPGGFNGSVYVEPYYWDSPVTGSTCLDLIFQVTDTDVGLFIQNPDGTFTFLTQSYYGTWTWSSSTNTGTWSLGSWVNPSGYNIWSDNNTGTPYAFDSLQVIKDDADLWTSVKVTPQAGTDQIYENTSAEAQYGYTTEVKSGTLHTSLNAALSTATYLGYLFHAPIPRVQNVDLHAETANGAYIPSILGPSVGTPINFNRTPPGATGAGVINLNMIVESISHDFQAEPGQWHASFTLDPYPVRS